MWLKTPLQGRVDHPQPPLFLFSPLKIAQTDAYTPISMPIWLRQATRSIPTWVGAKMK